MPRRETKYSVVPATLSQTDLEIMLQGINSDTNYENLFQDFDIEDESMASPFGDFVNAGLSDFLVKATVPDRAESDSDGFNAHALFTAIARRIAASKLSPKEGSTMIFRTVLIGLQRGNIREDQIGNTLPEGGDLIKKIIKLWGIQTRRNHNARIRLTPSTLTFSRFISLFPHFASKILLTMREKFDAKLPNANDLSTFPAQSQNLPAAMLHTGFGGLIPTDLLNTDYVALLQCAYLAFSVEFQRKISPVVTKTFVEAFEDQKKFLVSAMNSHISTEDRIMYLIAFGLNNVANVQSMIDVVNRAFTEMKIPTQFSIEDLPRDGDNIVIMEDEAKFKSLSARADEYMNVSKTHESESEDSPAGTSGTSSATSVQVSGLNLLKI